MEIIQRILTEEQQHLHKMRKEFLYLSPNAVARVAYLSKCNTLCCMEISMVKELKFPDILRAKRTQFSWLCVLITQIR